MDETVREDEKVEVRPEDGEVRREAEQPKPAWYVVHTYSGYENKVEANLRQRIKSMGMEDKIFNIIIPTEEEVELREGQRRTVQRKIFPGYILVEMILDEQTWQVVRNTPGVTGFVGSGNRPVPLSEDEVKAILSRMRRPEEERPIRIGFKKGETVRIIDGPFADFTGVVDEIYPEKGKVRVLVSIFGRETPLELDLLQVERL
jgi:transcriptional antiterminator NusG